MQKASGTTRWWDWASIIILFIIVETSASRLASTDWTDFLYLGQTIAYIGLTVGISLGYSMFSPRLARWVSFVYMLIFLPLQWTLVIDQTTSLEEQFVSLGGRLFHSYSDFFARRPVEDPIFFLTLITFGFWIIGSSAGFQLVRRQNYLAAVTPSAVVLLVIQNYDNAIAGRAWIIAFFAFMALLLLGRLHHLANKQKWKERRIFLSPDNSLDLTSIMAVAAGLIILVSWTSPASLASLESAAQTWNRITRPWRDFTLRMENAISALQGTGGRAGEFYGPELALGSGFEFTDAVMFTVRVSELKSGVKPPRFYWKGRTYDHYENGQWYTTGSDFEEYSPNDTISLTTRAEQESARFIFNAGDETFSLIYAPGQPVWVSRQGSRLRFPVDGGEEIVSWYANPILMAGETYQVEAVLSNPNTKQLREAGTNYPDWIMNKYLQLPDDFSFRVRELALDITQEAGTPYDKAVAITKYLRDNITYADTLPDRPRNRDLLEWMLFENKQGYCVYYSSAQILMLRSLGIPARMAVGFAEGERNEEQEAYTIRKENAHAWPEVYFPDVGWVEFEPTGNQLVLTRPVAPEPQLLNNPANSNPLTPDDISPDRDESLGGPIENGVPAPSESPTTINRGLYLIPLLLAFAALAVYFNRRYSVAERIPVLLRASYERSGSQIPAWIVNWERWVNISPIEKAFESINFSLRLLEKPMPVDATPIERAGKLEILLPLAKNEIGTLLDEHQTSLYTSRQADASRARRAAFHIRRLVLIEWIRYLWEGKPIESP